MPDTVGVNVSQFTPSTQVLSPLETPPAAVAVQVTGCELGVIVPEVGLAAPSRITLSRQMKLATKNPPAKIHRIFFIERLPEVESDAGSAVAASAPRECFRSSVDAFAIRDSELLVPKLCLGAQLSSKLLRSALLNF